MQGNPIICNTTNAQVQQIRPPQTDAGRSEVQHVLIYVYNTLIRHLVFNLMDLQCFREPCYAFSNISGHFCDLLGENMKRLWHISSSYDRYVFVGAPFRCRSQTFHCLLFLSSGPLKSRCNCCELLCCTTKTKLCDRLQTMTENDISSPYESELFCGHKNMSQDKVTRRTKSFCICIHLRRQICNQHFYKDRLRSLRKQPEYSQMKLAMHSIEIVEQN